VPPEGRTRGSRKDRAHTRERTSALSAAHYAGEHPADVFVAARDSRLMSRPRNIHRPGDGREIRARCICGRLLNGDCTGCDGGPADGINSSETMRARSAGYITNAREMAQPRLPARHARYHENCPLYIVCISVYSYACGCAYRRACNKSRGDKRAVRMKYFRDSDEIAKNSRGKSATIIKRI